MGRCFRAGGIEWERRGHASLEERSPRDQAQKHTEKEQSRSVVSRKKKKLRGEVKGRSKGEKKDTKNHIRNRPLQNHSKGRL